MPARLFASTPNVSVFRAEESQPDIFRELYWLQAAELISTIGARRQKSVEDGQAAFQARGRV